MYKSFKYQIFNFFLNICASNELKSWETERKYPYDRISYFIITILNYSNSLLDINQYIVFIEKSRSKCHSNRFLGCALSSGNCTVTLSYCSLHEPVQGDLFVLLPFLNLHSTWTRYQETVPCIIKYKTNYIVQLWQATEDLQTNMLIFKQCCDDWKE
jgi:hypothetical protein